MSAGKILLVEDEISLRRLFARQLDMHYRVHPVESGESALRILDGGEKFDLTITDVNLGKGRMSGVQFLRQAKQKLGDAGVIILSARADNLTKEVAQEFNAELLSKPFRREELINIIEKLGLKPRVLESVQSER